MRVFDWSPAEIRGEWLMGFMMQFKKLCKSFVILILMSWIVSSGYLLRAENFLTQTGLTAFQRLSILNGSPVSTLSNPHVRINFRQKQHCSGILITNQWVLTARHCFDNIDFETQLPKFSMIANDQWASIERVVLYPEFFAIQTTDASGEINYEVSGADIALIKLQSPLLMNQSTQGYERQISLRTKQGLVGKNVDCFGYGVNDLQLSFQGELRVAQLTIQEFKNDLFIFLPNQNQQISYDGDSGGACLYKGSIVANIQSDEVRRDGAGNVIEVTRGFATASLMFRQWVASTIKRLKKGPVTILIAGKNVTYQRGDDGAIWSRSSDGNADWVSLENPNEVTFVDQPAVLSYEKAGVPIIEIYAYASDHSIYKKMIRGEQSFEWVRLWPNEVFSAPAVVRDSKGNTYIFALGKDGVINLKKQDVNGRWIKESLNGSFQSPPVATLRYDGDVYVFAVDQEGTLLYKVYEVSNNAERWSDWMPLHGSLGKFVSAPAVTVDAQNKVHLFIEDADEVAKSSLLYSSLEDVHFSDLSKWSSWAVVPGQEAFKLSLPPSAFALSSGVNVDVVDDNTGLYWRGSLASDGQWNWTKMGESLNK